MIVVTKSIIKRIFDVSASKTFVHRDDKRKYNDHKSGAKRRGIPWHFTIEEWMGVWERSGKYHERGIGMQQYCMSRKGDAGPYSVDNVLICTNAENTSELIRTRAIKYVMTEEEKKIDEKKTIDYENSKLIWAKRRADIASLRQAGWSLIQIGKRYGISKQRVYQIVEGQ